MAITRYDILWLEPGFETPERSQETDAQTWTVWADMTGTPWAMENRFPFAALATLKGTSAHFLVERLYEIHGRDIRYGLKDES